MQHLNAIRRGDKKALSWFSTHAASTAQAAICLCPTNREAAAINEAEASKLRGDWTIFRSISCGKVTPSDKPTDDILRLKPGMQIMALVNDREGRYQNGSIGVIIGISNGKINVRFENGNSAIIRPFAWDILEPVLNDDNTVVTKSIGQYIQLPVRVAYAITIHKSQGQTFSKANLTPSCFATGQLYVAISRMTHISGLYLTAEIKPTYLKTSKTVRDFYRSEA